MPRVMLLPLLLLFLAPSAWGFSCSFVDGYQKSRFPISIDKVVSSPRDKPIGSVLHDFTWQTATGVTIDCGGWPWERGTVQGRLAGGFGAPVQGIPGYPNGDLMESGIPGVGIQVWWCNYASDCPSPPAANRSTSLVQRLNWGFRGGTYVPRNIWWVRLVKTGEIQAGAHGFNGMATVRYADLDIAELTVHGTVSTAVPACRMQTRDLVVRMPTVHVGVFQRPEETGAVERPFDIVLDCDAGIRLSYRIDPLHGMETPFIMRNRPGAGMANVGIQVLRANTATPETVQLAVKHAYLDATEVGLLRMPFLARYVAMSPGATPGLVSTSAMLTLSYE